jgi:hypothetical protein
MLNSCLFAQGFFQFENAEVYYISNGVEITLISHLGIIDSTNRDYYEISGVPAENFRIDSADLNGNSYLLYEDSIQERIYIKSWDPSFEDRVLFDFGQNVGDTVNSVLFDNAINTYTVMSVDTINYNGTEKKNMVITYDFFASVPFTFMYGVGSTIGFIDDHTNANAYVCHFQDGNLAWGFACNGVSLDEIELKINVSPNPFQNELFVELEEQIKGVISIIDLQGKTCHQEPINDLSSELNLSFMQSGVYILRFTNEKGELLSHQKIIKQ